MSCTLGWLYEPRTEHRTSQNLRVVSIGIVAVSANGTHSPHAERVSQILDAFECSDVLDLAMLCTGVQCRMVRVQGYSAAWPDQNSTLPRQLVVFYLYHVCSKR